MNDYDEAFKYFEKGTKSETLHTKKSNPIQLARNYDNMGICLCQQGNETIGLKYRMKAVRIIVQVHSRIQNVH